MELSSFNKKKSGFPLHLSTVLIAFFGMLFLVTITAYSRHTGNTGQDMSRIRMSKNNNQDIGGKVNYK